MPESTSDHSIAEKASDETPIVRQKWDPPALTLLGDTRTLTEAGGKMNLDSGSSSKLS